LAGATGSKQLDSHKHWSYNHCMNSVHSDGIDRMEIRQWLALQPTERNVPPEVLHRTAGFDASHHIAFGPMLVFEAHLGLRKNADLI
jgi:hypothetical protein